MQRVLLIVLAVVVIAAGIATAATIVLTDEDGELVIASPPPASPIPQKTTGMTEASPQPGSDGATSSVPGANRSGEAGGTSPATRTASDVDCDDEPTFCSAVEGASVRAGRRTAYDAEHERPSYSGVPSISLKSEVWNRDDEPADEGDEAVTLHVEVVVANRTDETFTFPKREIVFDLFRNGRRYDRLVTEGDGFDMTPGAKMTGTFDRPIAEDGTYTWQAKTWYHPE
jgi:hypothetical protein